MLTISGEKSVVIYDTNTNMATNSRWKLFVLLFFVIFFYFYVQTYRDIIDHPYSYRDYAWEVESEKEDLILRGVTVFVSFFLFFFIFFIFFLIVEFTQNRKRHLWKKIDSPARFVDSLWIFWMSYLELDSSTIR